MTNAFEIPEGMRLYVIGDIHGRSDLLDQMVGVIHRDIEKRGWRESLTITLGDYVDRGPDSRGVLERLADLRGLPLSITVKSRGAVRVISAGRFLR